MNIINIIYIIIAATSNVFVNFFLQKAAKQEHLYNNKYFAFALLCGTTALCFIAMLYKTKINLSSAILYLTLCTLIIGIIIDILILKNNMKISDWVLLVFISIWLIYKNLAN